MKPTTSYTDARKRAERQEIAWLLRLHEGEREFLAANRNVNVDGAGYIGVLVGNPTWRMSGGEARKTGGLARTEAEVVIVDDGTAGISVRNAFACSLPTAIAAELKMLWLDDPDIWSGDDAVTMLRGYVTAWAEEPGLVRLRLADRIEVAGRRKATRILARSWVAGSVSAPVGERLPIVFGRHQELRLGELDPGIPTRLREALNPGDSVLRVVSSAGMPAHGTLQAGDEIIEYDTLDLESGTLGSEAQPIRRSAEGVTYPAGEKVRCIPGGGFKWIAADHPCAEVRTLRADGVEVDSELWDAGLEAIGGVEAQVITMQLWPVIASHAHAPVEESLDRMAGGGAYHSSEGGTAINPQRAADGTSTGTFAELAEEAELLAMNISRSAAMKCRALGRWSGARVRATCSASKRWNETSIVTLRIISAEGTAEVQLPRPPDDASATGTLRIELDAAGAIPPETGWDALTVLPECRMEVIYEPDADNTIIRIHELDLRIQYYPRIGVKMADLMTAEADGWPDDEGHVVENPADILAVLLTDARFFGFDIDDLDQGALDQVRTDAEEAGVTYARVMRDASDLRTMLDEAASEASVRVRPGGDGITFAHGRGIPYPGDTSETLDDSVLLADRPVRAAAAAQETSPPDGVQVITGDRDGSGRRNIWTHRRPGADAAGDAMAERILKWVSPRASAPARYGNLAWERIREPAVEYEIELPPLGAMLEPGDTVELTSAGAGLYQAAVRVEEASLDGEMRVRLRASAPKPGEIVWQADELTCLRVAGYQCRLILYLAGTPVMLLGPEEGLKLRGGVTEESGFSAGIQPGPITWNGTHLLLSTGSAATWVPFARIDAEGNMELKGTVREEAETGSPEEGVVLTATSEEFILAPDRMTALWGYETATEVLSLARSVTEDVRL